MGASNSTRGSLSQAPMEEASMVSYNDTSNANVGGHSPLKLFMVSVYSFISLAIFFNFRVIYIVVRALCSRQAGKHGGNQHALVYVLSLSIVDSLVLAHLPLVATDMAVGRWVFGLVVCKLYWIIEQVNRILSTLILMALSADRYLAVCHPVNQTLRRLRTTKSAICVIIVSVFLAGALLIPTYIYSDVEDAPVANGSTVPKCAFKMDKAHWALEELASNMSDSFNASDLSNLLITQPSGLSPDGVFIIYMFVCGYCIPLTSMVFFYAFILRTLWKRNAAPVASPATAPGANEGSRLQRGQRRAQNVTQRVLVLVLVYFACWTPYWGVQFYLEFVFFRTAQGSDNRYSIIVTIIIVHLLTYLNSAVNPFLYALLNKELQPNSTSSTSSMRVVHGHKQRSHMPQHTLSGEAPSRMAANRAMRSDKISMFTRLFSNRRGSVRQDPNEIPLLTQNCSTCANPMIQKATTD